MIATSNTYDYVIFASCDIDIAPEVANLCNVKSMPAYLVYQYGNLIEKLVDPNVFDLEVMISKYTTPFF